VPRAKGSPPILDGASRSEDRYSLVPVQGPRWGRPAAATFQGASGKNYARTRWLGRFTSGETRASEAKPPRRAGALRRAAMIDPDEGDETGALSGFGPPFQSAPPLWR
jgi:hypothetical protein